MSDYSDDMDLDEDEIQELFEDQRDPDDLTPEEVFNMVMLNKIKGTKVTIQLEDKEGDTVELADILEGLIGYVKDRLTNEEESDFTEQIMPLMTQSVVSGLGRMIGIQATGFYLANEGIRHSIIHMMCVGFILLKYIQEHGLLINTVEEEMTDEEIEQIERKSQATSAATMASIIGIDPREALQQMVNKGQITQEDLASMMPDPIEEEDDDDTGDDQ